MKFNFLNLPQLFTGSSHGKWLEYRASWCVTQPTNSSSFALFCTSRIWCLDFCKRYWSDKSVRGVLSNAYTSCISKGNNDAKRRWNLHTCWMVSNLISTFSWNYFNEFLGVSLMKSEYVPIQFYFELISISSAWTFAMVQIPIMEEFHQTFCVLGVWMDRGTLASEIQVEDWCVKIKLQEVSFEFKKT